MELGGKSSKGDREEGSLDVEFEPAAKRNKMREQVDDVLTAVAEVPLPVWWNSIVKESLEVLREQLKEKEKLLNLQPGRIVPLPSIVSLTARFTPAIKDGKVHCMQRESFVKLMAQIQNKKGLTSMTGPQGAGKSFALFHLWCTLRISPGFRVLYVPNCGVLNGDAGALLMMDAIIEAFAEDALPFFNFMLRSNALTPATGLPSSWQKFLREVGKYCARHQLQFVAIFDQYNDLLPKQRKKGPTDFQWWPSYIQGSRIVVSASLNNEEEPIKTEDKLSPYIFKDGYTSTELDSWQMVNRFFCDEDISELANVTSSLPLELDRMLDLRNETLSPSSSRSLSVSPSSSLPTFGELLSRFVADSLTRLSRSYQAYKDNHLKDDTKRSEERVCLWHAAYGVPLQPGYPLVYDRKLFLASRPSAYDKLLIQPVTPLVQQMALLHIEALDLMQVESTVSASLRSSVPSNDAKGRIVEGYLIHQLSKQLAINLPLTKVGNKEGDEVTPLKLDNLNFTRFTGLVPPQIPSQSTIFVPSNPNYHDVDIFIWDHERTILYAIQITVGLNPTTHANHWITTTPSDGNSQKKRTKPDVSTAWQQATKWKESHKVWITSKPLDGSAPSSFLSSCANHFYVVFSDPLMLRTFPALREFRHSD